ncbi:restriction endonuclease subunit S [Salinicola endophyticus]|uniref:Restriction endonuclease subunit S n=1 Tax=Salinicola endophyticus TaxID=1949083 RepID=A0ABY8FGQ8_9GAMM|nr:restriction endonuclease subunit S [Salinicola endophyticus]WFF41998.1 restriction endonuclease subunit S [Salinicola endophyticus]
MSTTPFPALRLKHAATVNDEALSESTDADFELAYIDIGNVDSQGRVNDVVNYRFEDAPSRARRVVRDGDVIISTVRTYLQAIAPVENPPDNLIVSTGFAVVRPSNLLDNRFCKYALRANRFLWEVESRSTGVSYPAINASDLGDIKIGLPEINAQRLIAKYLDRETAFIDGLIAEKEHLLALLEEKRVALISRIVTRGLDPDIPFKPSGLKWVDEIPAHWDICQLKRTWASSDYGLSESIKDEGDITVLRMSCIIDGRIDVSKSGMITKVDEHLLLQRNDLLFNRTNSLDQIAKVGLVDFDPDEPLTFASYLVRIRANHRATPQYLVALLNSSLFLKFARKNAIPAIGQANLSPTRYGDIHIPLPPKTEQNEIAKFLERDAAISIPIRDHVRRSMSLLKERRAALITAAVTGQIPLEEMSS